MTQEIAEKILNWIRVGENTISTQAPLLAEEIVKWEFYHNIIKAAISLLLSIICCKICLYSFRKCKLENYDSDYIAMFWPSLIVFVVSVLFFLDGFMGSIKSIISPRMVVLDYISNFVR